MRTAPPTSRCRGPVTRSPTLTLFATLALLGAGSLAAQDPQPPERPSRAEMQQRLEAQLVAPRPIPAVDSVWIEDLTWMEVRDALAEGRTTALVTSGGIEQNGPYLVTGKHNVILRGTCERIARALGDALCAPVIKLVPEGDIDPPTGHMLFPGTLSVRQETYRAVLTDVARSLAAHGFTDVVFLGDSGGNQEGMRIVADQLDGRLDDTFVHFVPEYYRYEELFAWMTTGLGIEEPVNEGLHDNYAVTAMMMTVDPLSVRYPQRIEADRASINGVPLEPLERTLEVGEKLMARKVDEAIEAIRRSIADSRVARPE